jgi:hypothetical protein
MKFQGFGEERSKLPKLRFGGSRYRVHLLQEKGSKNRSDGPDLLEGSRRDRFWSWRGQKDHILIEIVWKSIQNHGKSSRGGQNGQKGVKKVIFWSK